MNTLYFAPGACSFVPHAALEIVKAATGDEFEAKLVKLHKGEQKSPEYLAINPMGKVPAIVHRGVVVTEAAAICAYLADAFPDAGLAPATGDPARGTYFRWFFFSAGCVEPAVVDKVFARPPVGRPGAIGYGTYEDTLKVLESALKPGPFILGERFSAVDVYVGSQIIWGMRLNTLEPRPAFEAYAALCTARPAFARASA
jgi:glutathione S-transferase